MAHASQQICEELCHAVVADKAREPDWALAALVRYGWIGSSLAKQPDQFPAIPMYLRRIKDLLMPVAHN